MTYYAVRSITNWDTNYFALSRDTMYNEHSPKTLYNNFTSKNAIGGAHKRRNGVRRSFKCIRLKVELDCFVCVKMLKVQDFR